MVRKKTLHVLVIPAYVCKMRFILHLKKKKKSKKYQNVLVTYATRHLIDWLQCNEKKKTNQYFRKYTQGERVQVYQFLPA